METLSSVSFILLSFLFLSTLFSLASVPFNEDYDRVKRDTLSLLDSPCSLAKANGTVFFPVRSNSQGFFKIRNMKPIFRDN